jgi:hypothetical protein
VVEEGRTLIVVVVAEFDQRYEAAPEAVNVWLLPSQTVYEAGEIIRGTFVTVTQCTAVAVHPFTLVPVTW